MIIEEGYIDKDYLVDFQRFFVRSFEHIKKYTVRIHFFSNEITQDNFEKLLKDNKLAEQQQYYLGFSIVRPIYDLENNPRIGRTLLRTYPDKKDSTHNRVYITEKNDVHLFGTTLTVKSVPFQAQDRGVSACATVALWTTLQSLAPEYKLKKYSPAEITELATAFPSQFRMFPQGGLTIGQMINCIRSTGLDVEVINALSARANDIITTAVKAYTYAEIPIIANLMLTYPDRSTPPDHHAVVVVGYQCDSSGNITELYVHDDNLGPFKKVKPDNGSFAFWENSDNHGVYSEYDEIRLLRFLIPIYHKVRLTFAYVYYNYCYRRNEIDLTKFNLELLLTTVQKYKKDISDKKIKNKTKILCTKMPRFLWIQRTTTKDSHQRVQDDIFDGTAIECKGPNYTVEYCKNSKRANR